MTYKEALNLIKDVLRQHKQQIYDAPAIMAYSAMEKQIPKIIKEKAVKPKISPILTDAYVGKCPNCKTTVGSSSIYCSICGQRLDWED